jgi:Ig domain protein
VQNGTISLKVTPYVGTYDGQEHNALSEISVEPSDAKLEYSINGGEYSEEMPKIKDTSEFTVTVVASKEGYKTVSTTETIKVNRAEGKLTLSSYSGTLTYPNSTSFTINENTTNVSITSSNTNIATASLNGNTVTVNPGTTAGKAMITVTTKETINYTSKTATYEATVKNGSIDLRVTPYTGTYDGRQHNAVTVNVTPSDAKIEYSINGGTYSTTMPTVINTSSFTVTVRASKKGYKTESSTQTTKVNKANGSLSLSSYSGTINHPSSISFTASGTGDISAKSSNTGVATVSVSGNTITAKSVGAGSATITVKSASNTNYNEKTAAYAVTVKIPTFTESSGVGYYADIDGNGSVDGIIFEDFKVGGSGTWGNANGKYTIPTVSETKNYYISKKSYTDKFGTKDVLTPIGTGNNRFYVMTLTDKMSNYCEWAPAKEQATNGWNLPTRNELAAFSGMLNITISNRGTYGLHGYYWTSEGYGLSGAWVASYEGGYMRTISASGGAYVRLCRTF